MPLCKARAIGVAVLIGSASMLAACDDEPDTLGEAIEEAGDQFEDDAARLGDAIDDATNN